MAYYFGKLVSRVRVFSTGGQSVFQGENDPEFVPGVDIDRLVAWCRMEFPYLGHYPVYPDCNGKIVSRESISKTPYFGASLRDDSDARYLGGICHSGIAGFVAVS